MSRLLRNCGSIFGKSPGRRDVNRCNHATLPTTRNLTSQDEGVNATICGRREATPVRVKVVTQEWET